MDKVDKKARLRAWREGKRDAARARLPLDHSETEALLDMLDTELPRSGCNHTRRLTDAWLQERGHSIEEVHRWLDDNSGFCDCTVLANAEQAWRFASGRD
jgi:hypothetical protein